MCNPLNVLISTTTATTEAKKNCVHNLFSLLFFPPSSWWSFNRFVALWICRLVGLLKRFVTIYHLVSLFSFYVAEPILFDSEFFHDAHTLLIREIERAKCVCGAFRRESIKIRWAHTPQIVCSHSVDARAQLLSLVIRTKQILVYFEPDLVYYLCWVFCMCISCNWLGSYFSLLLGCKLSVNYIHTERWNDITLRYNQHDNYTLFVVRVCHVIPSSAALVAFATLLFLFFQQSFPWCDWKIAATHLDS